MDGMTGLDNLTAIPLIDACGNGPLAVAKAQPQRLETLIRCGRKRYGAPTLKLGDALTKRWLSRAQSPFKDDLAAMADHAGQPGIYMLNLSYEWTCTSSVGPAPSGDGNRMLRTLDWPLAGLGSEVVVARHEGPSGPWFDVTWPGAVGCVTAMAPGRFSAAINQPPFRKRTNSCWLDWALERGRVWKMTGMPPVHLLRYIFETCESFEDAKRVLSETPIAMPAFFTLSGAAAGDGAVIERTETEAFVRDGGDVSIANHWMAAPFEGHLRGFDSPGRFRLMEESKNQTPDGFDWVRPPILNKTTRLAVVANAGTGDLQVRGYEGDTPATADFNLREAMGAGAGG